MLIQTLYYKIGLTGMACFLQRLTHLNIESCQGIGSIALPYDDIKLNKTSPSSYYEVLNPPNLAGLPGCKLLQYLNVSNCIGMTVDSIERFVRAFGRLLKVRAHNISGMSLFQLTLQILPYKIILFIAHSRSKWMVSPKQVHRKN